MSEDSKATFEKTAEQYFCHHAIKYKKITNFVFTLFCNRKKFKFNQSLEVCCYHAVFEKTSV